MSDYGYYVTKSNKVAKATARTRTTTYSTKEAAQKVADKAREKQVEEAMKDFDQRNRQIGSTRFGQGTYGEHEAFKANMLMGLVRNSGRYVSIVSRDTYATSGLNAVLKAMGTSIYEVVSAAEAGYYSYDLDILNPISHTYRESEYDSEKDDFVSTTHETDVSFNIIITVPASVTHGDIYVPATLNTDMRIEEVEALFYKDYSDLRSRLKQMESRLEKMAEQIDSLARRS